MILLLRPSQPGLDFFKLLIIVSTSSLVVPDKKKEARLGFFKYDIGSMPASGKSLAKFEPTLTKNVWNAFAISVYQRIKYHLQQVS